MKKFILLLYILCALPSVIAEQLFQATTGQTIAATISNKDLTRIQVSGLKIVKAFTSASIKIKKDTATGQLYLLPTDIKGSFNLFIEDSNGGTFNLFLTTSKKKGGDSIVIMPDKASLANTKMNQMTSKDKNSSYYERNIMNLIQVMYLGLNEDDGINYQVTSLNTEIPMWKKIKVVLTKSYADRNLIGYLYTITNNDSTPILLEESEFFKKGVLAVAIDNPSIATGDSTRVFVIKENAQELQ